MIRLRRGVVKDARAAHPGLTECAVEVEGAVATAFAYDDLTGPVAPGDTVVLNTTAVALGLGTGGVHFVVAVEGREPPDGATSGHAMKLRYTPLQIAVDAVEETNREAIDAVASLDDMPVVVAGLHSALAPVVLAARALAPGARIAYVMTDGAALPLAFSRTVPALRAAGLVDAIITSGQSFGGDHEAVSLFGALAAAKAVARADLAVVSMGPGNLGTGSAWGFALIETAAAINAAGAMGGRPIVVPRLSFADQRPRHQGLSHHTIRSLAVALAPAEIALPPMEEARARAVRAQLTAARVLERHTLVEVDLGPAEAALAYSPIPLETMGRTYAEDPDYFRAAAAGAARAARLLVESPRW